MQSLLERSERIVLAQRSALKEVFGDLNEVHSRVGRLISSFLTFRPGNVIDTAIEDYSVVADKCGTKYTTNRLSSLLNVFRELEWEMQARVQEATNVVDTLISTSQNSIDLVGVHESDYQKIQDDLEDNIVVSQLSVISNSLRLPSINSVSIDIPNDTTTKEKKNCFENNAISSSHLESNFAIIEASLKSKSKLDQQFNTAMEPLAFENVDLTQISDHNIEVSDKISSKRSLVEDSEEASLIFPVSPKRTRVSNKVVTEEDLKNGPEHSLSPNVEYEVEVDDKPRIHFKVNGSPSSVEGNNELANMQNTDIVKEKKISSQISFFKGCNRSEVSYGDEGEYTQD